MKMKLSAAAFATACVLVAGAVQAQNAAPDNGTDPTRFSTTAEAKIEHLALPGGFSTDITKFALIIPLGEKARTNLRVQLPVLRNDVRGNNKFAMGDASLRVNHVLDVTRAYGIVVGAEMNFDTADRPELGTGKHVFKGTFIYAKFLEGGDIFAPAVVQSNSLGGNSSRAKVNNTVFDFYYVPKLADPQNFITVDPALSFDWETNRRFASLAVTLGRAIGPALGGNSQIFIKPSVFAGNERSAKWGVEVGYKVIGF
jgi:hypothetical protein